VIDHAASITVAVLLVHGATDTRVPTAQSIMLADAMRAARRHVELVLLEGRGHSFGTDGTAAALSHTRRFFAAHLGRDAGESHQL
jgi:dipeptidyl aminopeptidase/acylaminoacyl peptidase